MGNLQSVLGDCTIREVPDFVSYYVPKSAGFFERRAGGSKSNGAGDETYIVYAEKSAFPNSTLTPADAFGASDDKASLMQDYRQHTDRQEKILADLVDLCVDGVDTERRPPQVKDASKTISGAQVYTLPKASNSKHVRTEVWNENENENEREGRKETGRSSPESVSLEERNPVETIVKPETPENSSLVGSDGSKKGVAVGEGKDDELVSKEKVEAGIESLEEEREGDARMEQPVMDQTLVRLNMCREEEKELRKSFVILAFPFEMDEESKRIHKWYIVEASWFRQWSQFLQGASRPGPITNELLFDRDGQPKEDLRPGEHYFGMDQEAWSQLADRYGCDVAVCKSSYDVYT